MTTPEDDEFAVTHGAADGSDQVRAAPLIQCFGGIRPMAAKLGVAVSTVQGWKQRDAIPVGRLGDIEAAAAEHDIALPRRVQATGGIEADDAAAAAPARVSVIPPSASPIEDTDSGHDEVSEVPQPKAAQVRTARPETARPETARPETARPETGRPETARPETARPETGRPETARPETARPETGRPETARPETARPETARPETARPEAARAEARAGQARSAEPLKRERAAPAPRRAGGAAVAIAFLALLVAAGAVGTVWWATFVPRGPLPGKLGEFDRRIAAIETASPGGGVAALDAAIPALNDRIAALERRVAALSDDVATAAFASPDGGGDVATRVLGAIDERVTALEQAPAPASAPAPVAAAPAVASDVDERLAGLARSLSALERQLGAVEQRPAVAAADPGLGDAIARLNQRLAALEAQPAAGGGEGRAALTLFLAAGRLQSAVTAGRPYAEELAVARRLAMADADLIAQLAPLAADAATGVARVDVLRTRFAATARAVIHAAATAAGDDWLGRTRARARSVVSVRRVGEPAAGQAPADIVARAEARLVVDDLAGAVAELAALDGAAATAATSWLAAARARLDADAAVAALDAYAVTILDTAGGR